MTTSKPDRVCEHYPSGAPYDDGPCPYCAPVDPAPKRDYLAILGYAPDSNNDPRYMGKRTARCLACGWIGARHGDVMRGHRRRCPVSPADPYTPAVCDS